MTLGESPEGCGSTGPNAPADREVSVQLRDGRRGIRSRGGRPSMRRVWPSCSKPSIPACGRRTRSTTTRAGRRDLAGAGRQRHVAHARRRHRHSVRHTPCMAQQERSANHDGIPPYRRMSRLNRFDRSRPASQKTLASGFLNAHLGVYGPPATCPACGTFLPGLPFTTRPSLSRTLASRSAFVGSTAMSAPRLTQVSHVCLGRSRTGSGRWKWSGATCPFTVSIHTCVISASWARETLVTLTKRATVPGSPSFPKNCPRWVRTRTCVVRPRIRNDQSRTGGMTEVQDMLPLTLACVPRGVPSLTLTA
jgi:hypothetical protein